MSQGEKEDWLPSYTWKTICGAQAALGPTTMTRPGGAAPFALR